MSKDNKINREKEFFESQEIFQPIDWEKLAEQLKPPDQKGFVILPSVNGSGFDLYEVEADRLRVLLKMVSYLERSKSNLLTFENQNLEIKIKKH